MSSGAIAEATPALNRTIGSSDASAAASARRIRWVKPSASALSVPGSRTANSSPPIRATTSTSLDWAFRDRAHASEHPIAGLVAPLVVDALEIVDVERDDGDRMALASGVCQFDRRAFLEAAPVQQTGECVRPRLAGKPHEQFVIAACEHEDDRRDD
jgi:hypothetical protein